MSRWSRAVRDELSTSAEGRPALGVEPKEREVGLYSLWKFDSSEEIVFSSITVHASYW
jgi:hypothetical protein